LYHSLSPMCVWVLRNIISSPPILLRCGVQGGVQGGDGDRRIDAASPANLPPAHLTSPSRRAPTSLPPLHDGWTAPWGHHQTLIAPSSLDALQQSRPLGEVSLSPTSGLRPQRHGQGHEWERRSVADDSYAQDGAPPGGRSGRVIRLISDSTSRMECPFFRPATSCGMGRGRNGDGDLQQLSFLTISSSLQFFEGFILGMHSAFTSPPLDSHSFALFPTDVWICLGSKLLVLPMTKRDMDIFLIRHRRMAQRDLALERSTATHPVCW